MELGARLFRHLVSLPIAYFEARRVGDSVARVRELENIRNFLTSFGAHAGHRPALHLRVPGGNARVLAIFELHYVAASSRVLSLGKVASQSVQLVSKLVTAGVLFFGAKLVIDGSLSVGELVAFKLVGRTGECAGAEARPDLAGFSSGRLSVARLGDILNTPVEPTFNPGRARRRAA